MENCVEEMLIDLKSECTVFIGFRCTRMSMKERKTNYRRTIFVRIRLNDFRFFVHWSFHPIKWISSENGCQGIFSVSKRWKMIINYYYCYYHDDDDDDDEKRNLAGSHKMHTLTHTIYSKFVRESYFPFVTITLPIFKSLERKIHLSTIIVPQKIRVLLENGIHLWVYLSFFCCCCRRCFDHLFENWVGFHTHTQRWVCTFLLPIFSLRFFCPWAFDIYTHMKYISIYKL